MQKLSIIFLWSMVFVGSYHGMEKDIIKQQDPHSIADLLEANGSYLWKLIKVGSGINYCHELCIAHQTLKSFLDNDSSYDWDRSLYSLNTVAKNKEKLEKRFGNQAVKLAHNLLNQEKIRRQMFSYVVGKEHEQFWVEKWGGIRRVMKYNDLLATLNLRDYSPGSCGQTLVHYVALENNMFLRAMLDNGANPHMLDKFKRSPLFYAIQHGSVDNIEILLKYEVSPCVQDCDGNTPLHWVVRRYDTDDNYKKIIFDLVSYGADPNVTNKWGDTPLHFAFDNGTKKKIKYLLALPSLDLSKCNSEGQSYLDRAQSQDPCYVRYILNGQLFKAFTNHCDDKGSKCKEVERLIASGADINARNIYGKINDLSGCTVLCYVLNEKCETCLRLLLEHKVNLNDRPSVSGGWSSYIYKVIGNEFCNAIGLLVNAGVSINPKENHGCSPLLLAAYMDKECIVKILLEYGALVTQSILLGNIGLSCSKSIFQLLNDAYEEQECCICLESQALLYKSNCLLSYIPCKNNHRRNFMCQKCYDNLKIIDGQRRCPFNCKDGLGEFDDVQ